MCTDFKSHFDIFRLTSIILQIRVSLENFGGNSKFLFQTFFQMIQLVQVFTYSQYTNMKSHSCTPPNEGLANDMLKCARQYRMLPEYEF